MTPEENLARITEEVNEQMRKFGYILPETNARLVDAQTGISNFDNKVQIATGAIGRLSDVVGDYTRAMYQGEKGAQTFNSGLRAMADTVTMAATGLSLLIPGSKIMKGVYAALTFLAGKFISTTVDLTETATAQKNSMFKTFSQLAKSGAAGADGVEGLAKDFQNLGLNLLDMDDIVRLIGDNAGDLALLGGTVRNGVEQFANLGLGMSKYEEDLRKLGLNEKEQADAAMRFAKMQSRLSLGQQQDYKNLADSAVKFIREQDTLTKITGLNAKQQSDALDEAMANERFAATIDELTRQGKHEEVKQLQERLMIAKSLGQEKGFADIVSGNLQTEAARQYNMLTQGQGLRETEDIKAGRFVTQDASGKATTDRAALDAARQRNLDAQKDTFTKMGGLGKVGVFGDNFGAYGNAAKGAAMAEKNSAQQMADARAATDAQVAATDTVVDRQSKLFTEQNHLMLIEQKFIGEHLPNIFATAMAEVVLEFTKKLNEYGASLTGIDVARKSRAETLSITVPRVNPAAPIRNPDGSESNPGPVGPNNPPVQRRDDTRPPYSRNNPLPVEVVRPDLTPEPAPSGGRNAPPLIPVPRPHNERAHGTSGEIGSLFEPKDIIAQLHKNERVLNKDENADLIKLFDMVTGDQSKNPMLDVQTELLAMIGGDKSKNKMPDAQGQMLKAIDSITSGMKTKVDPAANKGFDAAYADMSSGMMNTGPAQQALIDSQGEILKQIDSIKTNAMPTTTNTGALLGTMPSLEIDQEAVAQISQSFKESMGDEFKSAVTNINRLAGQMQSQVDLGLQQQMVGLLEEMRRSMQATAKASERLAQVASN